LEPQVLEHTIAAMSAPMLFAGTPAASVNLIARPWSESPCMPGGRHEGEATGNRAPGIGLQTDDIDA
jgi:hypothetical protein